MYTYVDDNCGSNGNRSIHSIATVSINNTLDSCPLFQLDSLYLTTGWTTATVDKTRVIYIYIHVYIYIYIYIYILYIVCASISRTDGWPVCPYKYLAIS